MKHGSNRVHKDPEVYTHTHTHTHTHQNIANTDSYTHAHTHNCIHTHMYNHHNTPHKAMTWMCVCGGGRSLLLTQPLVGRHILNTSRMHQQRQVGAYSWSPGPVRRHHGHLRVPPRQNPHLECVLALVCSSCPPHGSLTRKIHAQAHKVGSATSPTVPSIHTHKNMYVCMHVHAYPFSDAVQR